MGEIIQVKAWLEELKEVGHESEDTKIVIGLAKILIVLDHLSTSLIVTHVPRVRLEGSIAHKQS